VCVCVCVCVFGERGGDPVVRLCNRLFRPRTLLCKEGVTMTVKQAVCMRARARALRRNLRLWGCN